MAKFKNDRHYEESIVQALIVDHDFAEQMIEVLNVEYFNTEYLQEISRLLFNYYEKYRTFPSYKLLVTVVRETIPDEQKIIKEQIVSYLIRVKKEPLNGDLEYVKESSLDFCKKKSLERALGASLSLIEEKKYEQIALEIQKALQVGYGRNIGHVFKDEFDLRMQRETYHPVPTPWPELNKITKGGLGNGKLGIICAPTGVGKSHALVDLGAFAIMNGFNVVHYTLELSECDVGNRYDSRISGVSIDELVENQEVVKKKLDELITGNLIIKSFPTKTATITALRNHYNTMVLRSVKPDLIIIDYGDLLKSRENYDSKRLNEESVYEDLRGWSMELKVPIWTATQTNRDGLDVEVITLKYIAECFGKAMISDLFVTMNRKKDSPTPEIGNLFIAKSRMGIDGVKFPMFINTGISKIEILAPDAAYDTDPDGNDIHELREKFKKMKQSFSSTTENLN